MEFQKILDSIIVLNDFQIDDNEEKNEFLNYLWVLIRDDKKEEFEKIKKYFDEKDKKDLFKKIVDSAKDINKEYYDFDYFRDEKISDMNKIYLLNIIFTDDILINKGTVDKFVIPEISKEKMNSICYWITRAVYFCVNYNYDGNKVVDILNEYYHIERKLLDDIKKLYNENILTLKINNLTMLLNNDN